MTHFKYWDFDHDISHEMAEFIFMNKSENRYTPMIKLSFYISLFEQEEQVDICMLSVGGILYNICAYDKESEKNKYSIAQNVPKDQILAVTYDFVKLRTANIPLFFSSISEIKKYCTRQNKSFFFLLTRKIFITKDMKSP